MLGVDLSPMQVEPACGAALAVAYSPRLRALRLQGASSVVIEVCGGRHVASLLPRTHTLTHIH